MIRVVRTTLDLDDDVLLAAKELASARGTTAGKVVTDIYLLGLARKMGGCLATFDRTISLAAVAGATRSNLAVVSAT
jgi:predicted nucleic acid-binding protein